MTCYFCYTPDVRSELAAFLGHWTGKWAGKLCTNLYVTEVFANGAACTIFSTGDCKPWGVEAGVWHKSATQSKRRYGSSQISMG